MGFARASVVRSGDRESPFFSPGWAQKQILGFEPALRLEQVGDKRCEQKEDREHHLE